MNVYDFKREKYSAEYIPSAAEYDRFSYMSKQQRSLSRARQRPARCEACRAVPVVMQESDSPC